MNIETRVQMSASEVVGSSVHTDGESVVDGVEVERTVIEPTNLVQLDLADGRTFTIDPEAQATVTITIRFDDAQVGEFDADGAAGQL